MSLLSRRANKSLYCCLPIIMTDEQLYTSFQRIKATNHSFGCPSGSFGSLTELIEYSTEKGTMHTVWVRLNAVVFFGLTVMVSLSVLTWFSTITHRGFPTVDALKMNKLHVLLQRRRMSVSGVDDAAVFDFDLHADLSPAFNWNIKQLFVFVVAEYRTKSHPLNQVVVWDQIVEHPEDAVFHLDQEMIEYELVDHGTELRNTTINLRLVWDHMPITGRLFMDSLPTSSFKLPGKHFRRKQSSR